EIRFRNHDAILETHVLRNSLPSALTHHPIPTIGAENPEFVKKWNEICILKSKELLRLTITHVKENIVTITKKLQNIIQTIEEKDDPKITEKLPEFYADEEKKLAKFISDSWSKQIRHEIAPLIKITKRQPPPQPLNSQQEQVTSSGVNNNINASEMTPVHPTCSSIDSTSYPTTNQQYSRQNYQSRPNHENHSSYRTPNQQYSRQNCQSRPNQKNHSSYSASYHQSRSTVYKNTQQQDTTDDFSEYSNYHFNMPLMDIRFTPHIYQNYRSRSPCQDHSHTSYLPQRSPSRYSNNKHNYSQHLDYQNNNNQQSADNFSSSSSRSRQVRFHDSSSNSLQPTPITNDNNLYRDRTTVTMNYQQQQLVTIIDDYQKTRSTNIHEQDTVHHTNNTIIISTNFSSPANL
ncbi:unnamed protein product, partial [Didymodactylos carnosus]